MEEPINDCFETLKWFNFTYVAAMTGVIWFLILKKYILFYVGKTCPALKCVDTSKLFADDSSGVPEKKFRHTCRASAHLTLEQLNYFH